MGHLNTDVPELRGFDTGIVLENLRRLGIRMDEAWESTVAQLYELAESILQDAGNDPETVESILLSLSADGSEDGAEPSRPAHLLPDNYPAVEASTRHAGLHERLILYGFIHSIGKRCHPEQIGASAPRKKGKRDAEPPIAPAARGRVAYMPNPLADKAYLRFSAHVPACRAAAFHSFVDACEEVRGGLCEYCILPLETTADGKLTGFSRLIVKYHLYITAVCDVANHALPEGNITRFALLRRVPETHALPTDGHPRYLELLHRVAVGPSFEELLTAADFCGLRLQRVDTLPMPEEPSTPPPLCVVWEVADADPEVFLTYLTLEASEDTVMGMYCDV